MGHGGSWEGAGANTLDAEELPNFQRYSTHPYELGYEARQFFLSSVIMSEEGEYCR
jgi:hypothetical protein